MRLRLPIVLSLATVLTLSLFAFVLSSFAFASGKDSSQEDAIEAKAQSIMKMNISREKKDALLNKLILENIPKEELEKVKTKQQNLKTEFMNKQWSPKDGYSANSVSATSTYGSYPTRKGVILVTTDGSSSGIGTGHAGIIYSKTYTVESFPDGGVKKYRNDWNTRYEAVYGVACINTTSSQDVTAANWCYSKIGKPYNWSFKNTSTRSKFYCSQLVWAAYIDSFHLSLDDDGGIVWPADIANSIETYNVYVQ